MTWRIGLVLAVGCVATCAVVQGSEDPLEVCYREADASARVACFDHEMQRRHAAAAANQKRAQDNVGLEGPQLHQKLKAEGVAVGPVQPIVATITRLLPRSDNEYAFELDNGQTWEQAESKADLYVKPHDSVTIKPGVLGSFYMTTSRSQRIRVHRIR
jgi:hypothetical protein